MTSTHKKSGTTLDESIDHALLDVPVRTKSSRLDRIFGNSTVAKSQGENPRVIDVKSEQLPAATTAGPSQPSTQTGGYGSFGLWSFFAFVILPFIASAIYFLFIASDQYIAEARFAVRSLAENSAEDETDSSVLSMSSMPQDGFIVTSFIHSTEILNRLAPKINYREMFTDQNIDFLSRLDHNDSIEDFLNYWDNQVTTYIDSPSGIITLQTKAFSSNDAKNLASAIISESEALINELSARSQRDMTARFAKEVDRASANYSLALTALNELQNSSGLLTPEMQATETGSLLTGLLTSKLQLDSKLFVLRQSNATSSPTYQQLVLANKNLESQIEKLRRDLAGNLNSEKNVATAIQAFSRLETDRRVAEGVYEASRRNLEAAQAAATRKALYLVVFVPPTEPQESLYPHRFSTPLLLLLALTVAWVALALVWASVEDHRL